MRIVNITPKPVRPNYLRFTALESTNIAFTIVGTLSSIPTLNYSINGGTETAYTFGTQIALSVGDYCEFYGDNNTFSTGTTTYVCFSSTGNVNVSGNVMSLVDSSCESLEIPNNYCFARLFYECSTLINAKDLLLPATTMRTACYSYLFSNCTSLLTAPRELPAETLANNCYQRMFFDCSSLKTCPDIKATGTFSVSACNFMFHSCINLEQLPALRGTNYTNMCCLYMFYGCSKIKISQTPSAEYRYEYRIPYGTATGTSAANSFSMMFIATGGTFTGTPSINTRYYTSNKIVGVDYKEMPLTLYCARAGDITFQTDYSSRDLWYKKNNGTLTQLNKGVSLSTAVGDKIELYGDNDTFCDGGNYFSWFEMSGEFVCNGNIMSLLSKNNFTQLTSVPDYCFYVLLCYCPILTSPILPATTIGVGSYISLLYGTSIYYAPELPATVVGSEGYKEMLGECNNLITIPDISHIESLGTNACLDMFHSSPSIEVSETQSDYYNHEYKIPNGSVTSFQNMFTGTGGSFRGTPTPNTTYFTHNEVVSPEEPEPEPEPQSLYDISYYRVLNMVAPTPKRLTLTFLESGTFSFTCDDESEHEGIDLNYKLNNGAETSIGFDEEISVNSGDTLELFGDNEVIGNPYSSLYVNCSGEFNLSGDIRSLLSKNNFESITEIPDYCFWYLFSGQPVVSAEDLILGGNTIHISSLECLFEDSTILYAPKELPAKNVVGNGYNCMFNMCRSLLTCPDIKAEELGTNSMAKMFRYCVSLTQLPRFYATSIPSLCCINMFFNCPLIKLSTTQTGDYQNAYHIPNGVSASFTSMFTATGGTFTGTPNPNTTYYTSNEIVENSSPSLEVSYYKPLNIIYEPQPLNRLKLTFLESGTFSFTCDDESEHEGIDLNYKLNNGAETSIGFDEEISVNSGDTLELFGDNDTFATENSCIYVECSAQFNLSGDIRSLLSKNDFESITTIPDYAFWYMLNNQPVVSAEDLILGGESVGEESYEGFFENCELLTTSPKELPATIIGNSGYAFLFASCIALTTCSNTKATSLTSLSFYRMYANCSSLTKLPRFYATSIPSLCCLEMFSNCSQIKLSTTQTGDYQNAYHIPNGVSASFTSMFTATGGTFTGTPNPNTTYYTSNEVIE